MDLKTFSTSELSDLISAAQAELASRQMPVEARRVSIHCGGYNSRRYSRPWIARVASWPVGGRAELEFGSYCGNDSGGELEIMAKPGDIIRSGQKDGRGHGGSNDWAVVEADYDIRRIDQVEARKLFHLGGK